jgi:flagellar basal-body rod protein FlgF
MRLALPCRVTAIRDLHFMENATTIALSRLIAQQRSIDVTAANIANAATPGFHAERMLFSDWLVRQPGGAQPPGGGSLAYTQDRATYRDTAAGPLTHTQNPLDLALGSDGFFTVLTPRGPRLTRAGHFSLNSTGRIVDDQGNPLLDSLGKPIQIATADGALSITADGTISSDNGPIGKVGVVVPADPQKMQAEGATLFVAGSPTRPVAAPEVIQGAVEDSNVKPTVELARMMTDLREFQFVTQFLQGESDMQQNAIDKITQKGG